MISIVDGRKELYQWDTGVELFAPDECSQVHFANRFYGRSIDVNVVDKKVKIPDVLLQSDRDLIVWAYVGTVKKGYTKISKTFKVNRRNKPADYVFTSPDQTTLEEIQMELEELQAKVTEDKIKAQVYKLANEYFASHPQQKADWNENNSAKIPHILNRTHWVANDGTIHKLDNKFLDLDWLPVSNNIMVTNGNIINSNGSYLHREIFYNTDRAEEFSYIFSKCLETPFIFYLNGKEYNIPKFIYSLDGNYYTYNDGNVRFSIMLAYVGVTIFVYNENLVGANVSLYMQEDNKMPEKFMPELDHIIIKSSTTDSEKMFKITVNDNGEIIANEVTV